MTLDQANRKEMNMSTLADGPPFGWRKVRVFISSTFRDFHAERDYLIKFIFPELRIWCEKRKLHFFDIDLRWGITPAEAESGKVIDICLEQIDGSRPFFICMLGGRYGWVPSPGEISHESKTRYDLLNTQEGLSVTHMEINHAVLAPLISSTESLAAPHAFFYFRDQVSIAETEPQHHWAIEEQKEFRKVFFNENPLHDDQLTRLKESIIAHLKTAGKTVFNYSPELNPSLINPEDDRLVGRIVPESLKAFGEQVTLDIKKAIKAEYWKRFEYFSKFSGRDWLKNESDFHEAFVENRTNLFIGRDTLLKKINNHVKAQPDEILAVIGEMGSGKSSLLAQFYRNITRQKNKDHTGHNRVIIPHFIGASPGSSSLFHLLRRLCEELKKKCTVDDPIPEESRKLSEYFHLLLKQITLPVVILIDGVNQLDEGSSAAQLEWIPTHLPNNITMIVSSLEGDVAETLKKKTNNILQVTPLTYQERLEIINKVPSVFCKTIDRPLVEKLLDKPGSQNPLYLRVALEELRIFGSFEKLESLIDELPDDITDLFVFMISRIEKDHNDNRSIVEDLFCLVECSRYGLTLKELEELLARDKDKIHLVILRHIREYLLDRGELIDFFHQALSNAISQKYLSNSKKAHYHRALAEYFISKPTFLDGEKKDEPNIRKLIEEPWQIAQQGEMWDQLTDTLTDIWFLEAKVRAEMVYELHSDFRRALELLPEAEKESIDRQNEKNRQKAVIEGLIHYSRTWKSLRDKNSSTPQEHPLPDLNIIPFPQEIISTKPEPDKNRNVVKGKTAESRYSKLKLFSHFIRSEMFHLSKYGKKKYFFLQHAYNFSKETFLDTQTNNIIKNQIRTPLIVKKTDWRKNYMPFPAVLATFEVDENYQVEKVLFSSDSRWIMAASYSLKIWNAETGHLHFNSGQMVRITSLAAAADGSIVVTGHQDGSLRIFDVERNELLYCVDIGFNISFTDISITPDGGLAVTLDEKQGIHLWDCETGSQVCSFSEHNESIYSLYLHPSGVEVVAIGQKHIFRWDIGNPESPVVIEYRNTEDHPAPGAARSRKPVSLIFDRGTRALVATPANTIELMDISEGQLLRSIPLPTLGLHSVSVTMDGKLAAFGNGVDAWIWDLDTFDCLKEINGNTPDRIWSVSISADGSQLLTGHTESKVQLWDIRRGTVGANKGHIGKITQIKTVLQSNLLLSGGEDATVRAWEIKGAKNIHCYKTHKGDLKFYHQSLATMLAMPSVDKGSGSKRQDMGEIYSLGITSDSGKIITASSDGFIRIWEKPEKVPEYTLGGDKKHSNEAEKYVGEITILPDDTHLLSIEIQNESRLLIRCLRVGEIKGTIEGLRDDFHRICLAGNGRILLSCGGRNLQVWDLEKRRLLSRLTGHADRINDMAISPCGRLAVTVSGDNQLHDNSLRIWDLSRGKMIHAFPQQPNNLTRVAITPDGRYAVSGGGHHLSFFKGDNSLQVWDLRKRELAGRLEGHEHTVLHLSISSDGNYVTSASLDQTVRVWDLRNGECLSIQPVNGVPSSMDGDLAGHNCLACGTERGELTVLTSQYLDQKPPVVTAERLWHLGDTIDDGWWDQEITYLCPWCNQRTRVPDDILEAVMEINRNQETRKEESPCITLPGSAWKHQKLIYSCGFCSRKVRFNPFINDIAGHSSYFSPKTSASIKQEDLDTCDEYYSSQYLYEEFSKSRILPEELPERIEKLAKCKEQLSAGGNNKDYLFRQGMLFAGVGRFRKASDSFDKAIQADPDHIGALVGKSAILYEFYNLASQSDDRDEVLYGYKYLEEIIPLCEKVLLMQPENISALFYMGLASEGLDDHPKASEYYNKIIEIDMYHTHAQQRIHHLNMVAENSGRKARFKSISKRISGDLKEI